MMLSSPGAPWRLLAWLGAAIVGAAIAVTLLRIPVQFSDSLVPLLQVQASPSAAAEFRGHMSGEAFMRPLFWVAVKLALTASHGQYFLTFKGIHVALVAAVFALFALVAQVTTRAQLCAFLFALTVLTGIHTFVGTVWEAYPINHYLEIVVFCLATLALAQTRGGWWVDLAAPILFVVSALTIESGLIVWAVFAAAWLVGSPGVSRRGVALVTACLVGYVVFRVGYLHMGTPTLTERYVGFGFGRLTTDQLTARFGAHPSLLYIYNSVCAFLTVWLSEPQAGTWVATAQMSTGDMSPVLIVNVLSSILATGLVTSFAWTRRRAWIGRSFTHPDRLVLIATVVIAANAVISFPYAKDEVMSTGGVFYALAVYGAASGMLARLAASGPDAVRRSVPAIAAICLVLLTTGSLWTLRAFGIHYRMLYSASTIRQEWADAPTSIPKQGLILTPDGQRLADALRHDALETPVVNEYFFPRWGNQWFGSGRR